MTEQDQKRKSREQAKVQRKKLASAQKATAPDTLRDHLLKSLKHFDVMPPAVVSGYYPLLDEIDPLPAMKSLAALGFTLCLPVVEDDNKPLIFREWNTQAPLKNGKYGTMVPDGTWQLVRPTVLLIPLLAFDAAGYRLGWGGGYYDRTLDALRGDGAPVIAVGLGFEGQRMNEVPKDPHDQPLDWVITEIMACRTGHNLNETGAKPS